MSTVRKSKSSTEEKISADVARVLNAFRNLVRALRAADRQGMQRHGLGSAQVFVLKCLARQEPLSIGGLADLTATDQSTISVIVSKLVARDLVESRRAPDDARRVELTLTKKGRAIAGKVPRVFQQSFVASLEQLPKAKLRSLGTSLQELLEMMEIADEHPPMLFTDVVTPPRVKKSE